MVSTQASQMYSLAASTTCSEAPAVLRCCERTFGSGWPRYSYEALSVLVSPVAATNGILGHAEAQVVVPNLHMLGCWNVHAQPTEDFGFQSHALQILARRPDRLSPTAKSREHPLAQIQNLANYQTL